MVVGVAALVISGCRGDHEEAVSPVVTAEIAEVTRVPISRIIRAEALTYPLQQAAIVPKVSAPIKRVLVERGAHVRAGQVLVELENGDLAGAAQESQAAFEAAEAQYETTARATVPQETQKAELDLRAAKDALDAQQAIFESRQHLFQEGAIAQKDLNEAQVNLTQARNQFEITRKHLEDLRSFARDQAIKAATAERDQAQGRRNAAQAQLSYTRIVSPIDGTVTDRPFYAGETPPSGNAVITVMDLLKIVARAHLPPDEASKLKVGDAASIVGSDETRSAGVVTQISPALDRVGTTVEVWVQADNPGERVRAGSSVRVEIVAETAPSAVVVPESALVEESSGRISVILVEGAGTPRRVEVSVGIRDAGRAQIAKGLNGGERVVTSGAFELAKLDPEVLAKTTIKAAPPPASAEDEAK
jgi:multidrug efflux pump subunit AcrA (membrane-fusion protein)